MGASRSDAIVPTNKISTLNTPQPLVVTADAQGVPIQVQLGRRRLRVKQLVDRWLVEEGWWRKQNTCRLYFRVVLDDFRDLVVYRDLDSGQWWRQRD